MITHLIIETSTINNMSYDCEYCGNYFSKPFNLRRHMILKHDIDPMESEDFIDEPLIDEKHDVFGKIPKKYRRSDVDGYSSDSSSDDSSDDSVGNDSDCESNQSNTEDETKPETSGSSDKISGNPLRYDSTYMVDKWIQKAYRFHVDKAVELAEQMREENEDIDSLKRRVRRKLLPKYRKHFRKVYQRKLLQIESFRKNPIHKRVMKTVKKLKRKDGLDTDEAIRRAVSDRKHLINRLVSSDSEESSDESENSEPEDESPEETLMS